MAPTQTSRRSAVFSVAPGPHLGWLGGSAEDRAHRRALRLANGHRDDVVAVGRGVALAGAVFLLLFVLAAILRGPG